MFACPDNYISIALLNVRSIVAKLPESDIEHDHSLTSASILCFTETWLTPQLSSPVILGHHQVIRSDRMSGDNKGGVLISIPANIQASNQTEFSRSGVIIEALSTTLLFPNGCSFIFSDSSSWFANKLSKKLTTNISRETDAQHFSSWSHHFTFTH